MSLRRFTVAGMAAFEAYLASLRDEPSLPVPQELLTSTRTSESLGADVDLPSGGFGTRMDMAIAFDDAFESADLTGVERDELMWSWLACHYFDDVCPPDGNGRRKVREHPRYILQASNWRRYYRHLLAGPYRLLRANRDEPGRVISLLCGTPDTPGELYEQIAGHQELFQNPKFLGMVTGLYYDEEKQQLKRGAGGSGAGSPRRLAVVADQFDLTYDFNSLEPSEIAELLPKEFGKFRDK